MNNDTKTDITIALHDTFAPDDPPALFEMAREVGYESVEPPAPRGPASIGNPTQWPTEGESIQAVRALRQLSAHSGIRTDTFYGGGLWVLRDEDHPDRAARDVAFLSHLIPILAGECGARVLTVNPAGALLSPGAGYQELDRNGSAVATDTHYQRCADALRALGDVAGAVGMAIGVEMHGSSLADCGAAAKRLMETTQHPTVGMTWDTGNLFTMGRAEHWERQLELLAPFIVSVHLKNALRSGRGWRRTPLEHGAMEDVGQQVQALRATGYTGALVVEAPGLREGRREMAETDLRFLQGVLLS